MYSSCGPTQNHTTVSFKHSNGSPVEVDTRGVDGLRGMDFLEAKRGVGRVLAPELLRPLDLCLALRRGGSVELAKRLGGYRVQSDSSRGLVFPARCSDRASAASLSSKG